MLKLSLIENSFFLLLSLLDFVITVKSLQHHHQSLTSMSLWVCQFARIKNKSSQQQFLDPLKEISVADPESAESGAAN